LKAAVAPEVHDLSGYNKQDSDRKRGPEGPLYLDISKNMPDRYNVLFLCTGNSARSIMAEAILNFKGRPNFIAYSAGSHPAGTARPEALQQIELAHLSTNGLRSKSWDEFAQPGAPQMNFVFTVCDNAAKEICPVWPGQPMTAHWGIPDPAAVTGSPDEIERAYREAFMALDRRIGLFLALPLATLDKLAIQKHIEQIGKQ
jgi:arsenate reductase (thioredoxin)